VVITSYSLNNTKQQQIILWLVNLSKDSYMLLYAYEAATCYNIRIVHMYPYTLTQIAEELGQNIIINVSNNYTMMHKSVQIPSISNILTERSSDLHLTLNLLDSKLGLTRIIIWMLHYENQELQ
jgi:hypothetical protein